MMNMNKKTVAKAIVASIIAMNIYGVAFAAPGGNGGGSSSDTRQNIKVETKTDADGIKTPDLNHTYFGNGDHNNACGELIDNTDLTIGQINTVVDDLVANDKKLMSDIKNEAEERKAADAAEAKAREDADKVLDEKINAEAAARANGDIIGGEVKDSKISLIKGDGSTIDLDVSGITAGNDKYVDGASYNGDDQKLTLKRNDGTDIDVTLDNVAKASDLNDLDTKVGNIENNVTNIDKRVGTIEGNINNIHNSIFNIENDVYEMGDKIDKLEGETITDATFADNELTLVKDNGSTISVDGIASVADVNAEAKARADADKAEASARESADKKLESTISRETQDRRNADLMLSDRLMEETKNRMADDAQERADRIANDIVSGSAADGKITLVKGDNSTIDIEVDGLGSDTYIEDASYDGNDQKLTLKRNDGTDIDVTLDNVAKASDLNAEAKARADKDKELDQRLQNETHERVKQQVRLDQKIDAETDARIAEDAKLDQKINDESTARAAADDKLAGMDIASGKMDGNTLVLDRFNQETIEIDGIATTGDIEGLNKEVEKTKETIKTETEERKSEDERLDSRIDGVQQDISDLNGRINKLDGKINKGVALAIAHASLKPLDYDPRYKWTGSMGVGNYHGENAVAAGAFYQPNKDLLLNFSISMCGSEKGVGAGVSVRFK